MENIKGKAGKIAMKILEQERHIRLATESPDSEIDQNDLVDLMKLNKQLDIMKTRYNALIDPMLRELSTQEEHLERSYILSSSFCEEPSNIIVVASSVPLDKFAQSIVRLPELLKEFSQVPDLSRVKTLPSLQMALDIAHVGDVVALLPGSHVLKCLGSLGRGGTLLGLGENVEIVGCHETGDVLLDLNLEENQQFILQSLLLKPIEGQTSVFLHNGKMLVKDCVFQEGLIGLSFLGESECKMTNSTVTSQEKFGISVKDGSHIMLDGVQFKDCNEAAMLGFDGMKIFIESSTQVENCEAGLMFVSSCQSSSTEDLDLSERCIANFKNLHFKNVKKNCISISEISL
ncbi:hypothetical protein Anas_03774 [Armadillidium nasatum]|uniref:Right handed beta helix domain-containing protein n=1 Tax=Armadillidium nasatum TaxID=96803 RepID=A0A5N5TG88_9CRUS|nr:hypothetical protein Anas_03774 [Armadillidium nasatum]